MAHDPALASAPPAPSTGEEGRAAIEELARIRAIIPASLAYEVPDAAEAIRSTFREYVKVAAEATALRKQLADLKAGLGAPFMTCRSGDGKPHVRLQYQYLHDAQRAHSALVALFADRPSPVPGDTGDLAGQGEPVAKLRELMTAPPAPDAWRNSQSAPRPAGDLAGLSERVAQFLAPLEPLTGFVTIAMPVEEARALATFDLDAAVAKRIISARLTAWTDDHGGVDITLAGGRRVALALDAPHVASDGGER